MNWCNSHSLGNVFFTVLGLTLTVIFLSDLGGCISTMTSDRDFNDTTSQPATTSLSFSSSMPSSALSSRTTAVPTTSTTGTPNTTTTSTTGTPNTTTTSITGTPNTRTTSNATTLSSTPQAISTVPTTPITPIPITTATLTTSMTTAPRSNQTVLIAVLASIIPILALLIIGLIVCMIRRKPLKKKVPTISDGDIEETYIHNNNSDRKSRGTTSGAFPDHSSLPIKIEDFGDYLLEMAKDSDFKYTEQFQDLVLVGRDQTTDDAVLNCNLQKNRYINLHPYDITRVKLMSSESEEGSDYINASWIPGYFSKREYIACQGPLPSTEDDMWRMIWEYNCKGVVILTKCFENGKRKCHQYWPEDNIPIVYGDIKVSLVDSSLETEKWQISKLELLLGQEKKLLQLFHFLAWPDHGIPDETETLLDFMRFVKNSLETTKISKRGPLIIHCSAGVGRTGTYITIETLLEQITNENIVDVFGVVFKLRMNRVLMVQMESQYKFIHETIGHVIKDLRNENVDDNETEEDDNDVTLYANESEFRPQESRKKNAETNDYTSDEIDLELQEKTPNSDENGKTNKSTLKRKC